MPLARSRSAGNPYSGSMRIALAYGVSAFVTAVLNSVSDAGVACPPCWPICRMSEPRWSIAAARMIPRSSAQASMPFALPFVTRALVSTAISVSPCSISWLRQGDAQGWSTRSAQVNCSSLDPPGSLATLILRPRRGSDRRGLRELGDRPRHHAARPLDPQRERDRDEAEDRGRDEHEVVVAKHGVEIAPGVCRDRRARHV